MDPWVPGEINEFVDAVEYAMQAPLTDAFVRHVPERASVLPSSLVLGKFS